MWFMSRLLVVVALSCVLGGAESAFALPGDPGEPVERTISATLTVEAPAAGVVTGTEPSLGTVISCPGDCSQQLDYTATCVSPRLGLPEQCTTENAKTVTLTAARGSGWTADWDNGACAAEPAANVCEVFVTGSGTVGLTWIDTGTPTVALSNPATIVGPATAFTAGASDNVGIHRVEFFVDNVLRQTDTGAPFQTTLNMGLFAHGSNHELKVIAYDTNGNASSTLGSAPSHSFVVDKQTALTALDTPPALVNASPAVAFTRPADVGASGVTCRTKLGSALTGQLTSCASPYTAQLGAAVDGDYTVEFTVTDNVGNVATHTRSFELDRTGPALAITGGPADGATVQGSSASFNFSSSDANGVTLSCGIDGATPGPCGGSDNHAVNGLSAGTHTFVVQAVDGAGNSVSAQRTFTTEAPPTTASSDAPATNTPSPGAGGSGDSGTPGGQGEAAQPVAAAGRAASRFSVRGGKTRITKLTLSGLARGATIEVRCKGRGCFRGTSKFTARGSTLNLSSLFKKRTLAARAVVEVRIAQPGRATRLYRYTTQKGKKKPKLETLTAP